MYLLLIKIISMYNWKTPRKPKSKISLTKNVNSIFTSIFPYNYHLNSLLHLNHQALLNQQRLPFHNLN